MQKSRVGSKGELYHNVYGPEGTYKGGREKSRNDNRLGRRKTNKVRGQLVLNPNVNFKIVLLLSFLLEVSDLFPSLAFLV